MPKPQYLEVDTLDDRREIWALLRKLPPRRRVDFLRWCCKKATLPCSTVQPRVNPEMMSRARLAEREDEADHALTYEVFFDLFALSCQYDFSLNVALDKLVEVVRAQR